MVLYLLIDLVFGVGYLYWLFCAVFAVDVLVHTGVVVCVYDLLALCLPWLGFGQYLVCWVIVLCVYLFGWFKLEL